MKTADEMLRRIALVALFALPLSGIALAGRPLAPYLQFPPMTHRVAHAGFSWPVFVALAVLILAVVTPFLVRVIRSRSSFPSSAIRKPQSAISPLPASPFRPSDHSIGDPQSAIRNSPSLSPAIRNPQSAIRNSASALCPLPSAFPLWGWLGLLFGLLAWTLAWTRFPWFAALQPFTFTPLWLAYIVVVNALTWKRTGQCMMLDRPRRFLLLFAVSAAFWWFFEFLNRFVQNWYYARVADFSPLQYFFFATLPFSTVLPAVLGTYELLRTFPRLSAGLDTFLPLSPKHPKTLAAGVLLFSCAGLTVLGVWPDYVFPLLWLSPLLVVTSLQSLRGRPTIFSPVACGDWTRIALLALAALLCGVFWEMWNFWSFAKWRYTVPFVHKFLVFEMPILGYAGYLPFGLECAVIADWFAPSPTDEPAAATQPPMTTPPVSEHEARLRSRFLRGIATVNALVLAVLAAWYLVSPGILLWNRLGDPALRGPGIPRFVWRLHRDLTPQYEKWARARIASGKAAHLYLYDVPSTEWPMFGSVFYLQATENLQIEWDRDPSASPRPPREYARRTIEAATDLILDPVHHTWVRQHWGDNYMHRENVFFRAMIIAGLTSRQNLLQDGKHLDVLRDQVETLAADLDRSRFGLLHDYPEECYPIDVFAAVAAIRRADPLLGADHSAFVTRALRGFQPPLLDERGLIPYFVDLRTGSLDAPSRGIGMSYVLIFAPSLYPDQAREWYRLYERHFWQTRMGAAGFREYPRGYPKPDFFFDVDSGPVIAGFSPAGNAYGVAAARANGRFDHAYVLSAQVLAASWPLPDGTLVGGRILSNRIHAPHLGEANLLWLFTQQPTPGFPIRTGGRLPPLVYVGFLFYFGLGACALVAAALNLRRARRSAARVRIPVFILQAGLWSCLLLVGLALFAVSYPGAGVLLLLIAQLLPRTVPLPTTTPVSAAPVS